MKRIKSWFRTLFGSKKTAPVGHLARSGKKGTTIRQRVAAKRASAKQIAHSRSFWMRGRQRVEKAMGQTKSALRRAYDKAAKFLAPVWRAVNYVWRPMRRIARYTLVFTATLFWIIGFVVAPFAVIAYTILSIAVVAGYCVLTASLLESKNETAQRIGAVLRIGIDIVGVACDAVALALLVLTTVTMPLSLMVLTLVLDAFYVVLYNRRRDHEAAQAVQEELLDEIIADAPAVA
jgi:hypothetical protein